MPTYDYECIKCGHEFEFFQKMTDESLSECPKCGSPVKRLIGAGAGIIFKGSGFYATDYRKAAAKESSSEKKPAADTICPKIKEGCSGCAHG